MALVHSIDLDDDTRTVSLVSRLDGLEVARYTCNGTTVVLSASPTRDSSTVDQLRNLIAKFNHFNELLRRTFHMNLLPPPVLHKIFRKTVNQLTAKFDAGLAAGNAFVTELVVDFNTGIVTTEPRPTYTMTLAQWFAWRKWYEELLDLIPPRKGAGR